MKLTEVADMIREAKAQPVETWPGYDFARIPFAVYDDNDVVYIDHPNPPEVRPQTLMAATSVDINGVDTATIPLYLCTSPEAVLPIIYHEGFHVFQQTAFEKVPADMFTAMSYYPELDADYRALCRLETDVLRRDEWPAERRLQTLAALVALRRQRLPHDSLLNYERFLERNESTASYVEQKSRQKLFNINPQLQEVGHGWTRFYQVGAAVAWMLDEILPGWTSQVEQGQAISDILTDTWPDAEVDLKALDYQRLLLEEQAAIAQTRQKLDAEIDAMQRDGLLRLRYPSSGQVFRGFHPSSMVSLGDGRILHRDHFNLVLPNRGKVALSGVPVIDNVTQRELQFASVPVTLDGEILSAKTDKVEIHLSGVTQADDGVYQL